MKGIEGTVGMRTTIQRGDDREAEEETINVCLNTEGRFRSLAQALGTLHPASPLIF